MTSSRFAASRAEGRRLRPAKSPADDDPPAPEPLVRGGSSAFHPVSRAAARASVSGSGILREGWVLQGMSEASEPCAIPRCLNGRPDTQRKTAGRRRTEINPTPRLRRRRPLTGHRRRTGPARTSRPRTESLRSSTAQRLRAKAARVRRKRTTGSRHVRTLGVPHSGLLDWRALGALAAHHAVGAGGQPGHLARMGEHRSVTGVDVRPAGSYFRR